MQSDTGGKIIMPMTVGNVNNPYTSYPAQRTKRDSQASKSEVRQDIFSDKVEAKVLERDTKVANYAYETGVRVNSRYFNNLVNGSQASSKEQEDYVKQLQGKNPQIDISVGKADKNAKASNYYGKTDVRIDPKFLDKMMADPELADKYEKMLADIPALDRWADSMIKAMTGSEVKYRQVWIDEDGNMGSMVITGPSEAQKKQNEEKVREKKLESKKQQEELEEKRKLKREESEELQKKIQEAGKSLFGETFKWAIVKPDNEFVENSSQIGTTMSGVNLDMKL